ncbi:phosphomannomutase/phosphoglucomutase [Streptomyces europaeiscabiei]|uniref:Phosphomannomutase/phosphoglucomutase n=1 Tax=Streptomyces europaeiscabiei TaxID=146819 RepID=A0ABU4NSE1_9ACTN|nr:phosphomannomutase/phosphoglucomutase [Streptomyces europaeiscabiei]MDX2763535.1 phosphomannomutase/phosphoglucomutase [Streptomyces europaeiscabiei]MDX2773078.1 phosphomannomutase/phosphoglucomutase [Streptomyces europaeiscabiei]MDX3547295.1 phosphomannomutase/phosphoglucomutase [Streptomyces europaeiscabiei]MDX3556784.1 phosphomannomutase/phosphoglucomutase [Streptomyces europaeiscabiei]MDX3671100.1 phosphomannomutase/phosphoglucomutase [Streptomyces europaeiscabiei]
MAADLSTIVKAYDVRGVVPDQWDETLAELLGAAFVQVTGADAIVTGHDMRPSSPGLSRAFARGAAALGVDVTEIGLCSTDQLYYASGALNLPGAMFTASHNPARYNGIKMCRAGAAPVGQDTGLTEIRELVEGWTESGAPAPAATSGTITRRDTLEDYAAHLLGLVDLTSIRPLKVVVDAGNGMGGHTVPTVFAGLPLDLVPMYFELDGTFPNHEANPLDPANIVDLQNRVRAEGADLGIAFDGDADRCFVVDERGNPVPPSAITALVASRELARHGGKGTIIHNLITSWSVPEVVKENGGTPVRTRVGHSFIKAEMARTGAIFGGEHSAHYYFADFWNADTGMLAALHVLAALGGQDGSLSGLVAQYDRYAGSGEINSTVADQTDRLAAVRSAYESREDVTLDDLDGLTVSSVDWWFNVRPSNTEPLLRLNAEARDETTMAKIRDEVLGIIRA